MNPKDAAAGKKAPLHLLPWTALIVVSLVFRLGARKYGPFNWRHSNINSQVYIAAALRHIAQWQDGHLVDRESGVSHLAHAIASLLILLDAQRHGTAADEPRPFVSDITAVEIALEQAEDLA